MSVSYAIYGARIESDRPIPGLTPANEPRSADLRVIWGALPGEFDRCLAELARTTMRPAGPEPDHAERIVRRLPGGEDFLIRYDDATTFVVEARGRRVWAWWPEALTPEDTTVYLLGPVMAFTLRLRGVTCLHASAVSAAHGTVAFVGPSGAGKSTIAAALAARGRAVVCDDLLALETRAGTIRAHCGYPRLRLWPESESLVFGTHGALPLLTPNWDKRYLNLLAGGYRHEPRTRPLAVVYLLDARRGRGPSTHFERVRGSEGVLHLLANTRTEGLTDKRSQRRDFETLSRVARDVPMRRLVPGSGAGSMAALCDAVDADSSATRRGFAPPSEIACTI